MNSGGVPLVAVAATTVWGKNVVAAATLSPATATIDSEGGAAWNPFSPAETVVTTQIGDAAVTPQLPWPALALGALVALAGLGWWRWRRR